MKYSHSTEMLKFDRNAPSYSSNTAPLKKSGQYSNVVECKYEVRHISSYTNTVAIFFIYCINTDRCAALYARCERKATDGGHKNTQTRFFIFCHLCANVKNVFGAAKVGCQNQMHFSHRQRESWV